MFPKGAETELPNRLPNFCLLTAGEGWQKRLTECFRLISLQLIPYFGKAKDLPREVSVSKIVVSVIGLDCPGVVVAIIQPPFRPMMQYRRVSQTILKNQFAAIFVANKQESLDNGTIHSFPKPTGPAGCTFQLRSAILKKAIRPVPPRANLSS